MNKLLERRIQEADELCKRESFADEVQMMEVVSTHLKFLKTAMDNISYANDKENRTIHSNAIGYSRLLDEAASELDEVIMKIDHLHIPSMAKDIDKLR